MATIDMTHRKLNFPPRFLPYLEKHRIFELFHECVELLVQARPKDHIRFLKTILPCAAAKKDKQRIVFFAPESFDRETFCELLSECLGIECISRMRMEMLTRERRMKEEIEIEGMTASIEEESCICPGEASEFPPLYYPSEEPFRTFAEQSEEECLGETKFQEPCVCVCPCVKEQQRAEMEDKKEKEKGEGEGKDGDEGWVGEGEETPCEPQRRKKKKKHREPPQDILTVETAPSLDVDYGLLADCELGSKGWILQDFPATGEEAESLSALGVIPTHALRIIIREEEEESDRHYKWIAHQWMKAYRYVPVVEIRMGERNVRQLAGDMCNYLQVMPHRHAPMLPRVVLVGSRGSGVTTQAQKLSRKYGLVHVEYETVVARALQQDDELSRLYRQQTATRPDPEVEAIILEKVLMSSACRNRGWVLTGYPKNIDQMRMLDMIATPPNRVIFFRVPPRECFVRLFYRKVDACLGDEYKLPRIEPSGVDGYLTPGMEPELASRLLSHPKNDKRQIVHDIEQYFLEKKDMEDYCGRTASHVDGNQAVDRVFELIEQIIVNPAPAQPPRNPLAANYGIHESYARLKKFRLVPGLYLNNLSLNPPERVAATVPDL